MKKSLLVFFTFIFLNYTNTVVSQDISGQWFGVLTFNGVSLRINIQINKTGNGFNSTLDSPDQGAKGIPADLTTFENSELKIEINKGKIGFSGKYSADNKITGTFTQGGQSIPLEFGRSELVLKPIHSQEPVKPYPYYTEDVSFTNKSDHVTLSGTLSLPSEKGKFPVVVLISGSGPQNRDEELLGHKPFLVLADYLTRNGIGVLRFDDRGTAKSQGDFKSATTEDFSRDVEAAVKYLLKRKQVNKKKIGLIGHSEGGIIAPIVAANLKEVSFIVLMAGTGISGGDLLLLQQLLIGRSEGASEEQLQQIQEMNKGAYSIIQLNKDTVKLKSDLEEYYQPILQDKEMVDLYVDQLTSPWMKFFITYDPSLILKDVKCPVLALNGSKDLQVPSRINLEAIRSALEKGGNVDFTIKEFPEMNHLFQECQTGAIKEYALIDQTISPLVLEVILKWIKSK